MHNTPELALSQARQHFRHLGITIPAKLTKALAEVDRRTGVGVVAQSPDALRNALVAAVDAGVDPMTDEAVRAAVTGEQLRLLDVGQMLHDLRAERRAEAIRKHAPDLIEAMRPIVEAADVNLGRAYDELPPIETSDALGIWSGAHLADSMPPDVVEVWAAARSALAKVERVAQVWDLLVMAVYPMMSEHDLRALGLADLTAEQLDALPRAGSAPSALAASRHRLSLATLEEFTARRQRVQAERAEAHAAWQREKASRQGDADRVASMIQRISGAAR